MGLFCLQALGEGSWRTTREGPFHTHWLYAMTWIPQGEMKWQSPSRWRGSDVRESIENITCHLPHSFASRAYQLLSAFPRAHEVLAAWTFTHKIYTVDVADPPMLQTPSRRQDAGLSVYAQILQLILLLHGPHEFAENNFVNHDRTTNHSASGVPIISSSVALADTFRSLVVPGVGGTLRMADSLSLQGHQPDASSRLLYELAISLEATTASAAAAAGCGPRCRGR